MRKLFNPLNRNEKIYAQHRKWILAGAFILAAVVGILAALPAMASAVHLATGHFTSGDGFGSAISFAALGAIAPFKYFEQVTKISGVGPGQVGTVEYPLNKRLNICWTTIQLTKAAMGAGVKDQPLVTDALQSYLFKMGGKQQRSRTAAAMFGVAGLNALCDVRLAGLVVYSQVGNAALSTIPCLIGSANDIAQKALLTANTATTAVFKLPIIFSEPYRKEYNMTEVGALTTGFDDGTSITATLELTFPGNGAGVYNANFSGLTLKAAYEYDELLQKAGSKILLEKEYTHTVGYAASGDIETATQLYNNGDGIARVSLLVAAGDSISRVVVKQGSRVLRDMTYTDMVAALVSRDYNENAFAANRFDIEFDCNDDPNSVPPTSKNNALSIVATLVVAGGANNMAVLSTYYGGLD